MKPIRRVAVLGAGTMGARIAGHLANAQIPSLLLDVSRDAARQGLEAALKGRPAAFFVSDSAGLVTTGNFDDDPAKIADCDWIVEAVTENLGIKRALYDRVIPYRAPGAIVSTNTSGIPLAQIAEGYPEEFRQHFLGTHFFNPPRYLHLVEIIPGPETRPEILDVHRGFLRPPSRQRRGALQGHAELHRQPNRRFLRRYRAAADCGARSHDRGSGCAHRAADRASQERQLPAARHRRT